MFLFLSVILPSSSTLEELLHYYISSFSEAYLSSHFFADSFSLFWGTGNCHWVHSIYRWREPSFYLSLFILMLQMFVPGICFAMIEDNTHVPALWSCFFGHSYHNTTLLNPSVTFCGSHPRPFLIKAASLVFSTCKLLENPFFFFLFPFFFF